MSTTTATATHTPGPHIVKRAAHGIFIEAHPDLNDGHNTAVCFGPDAEANAVLYAAAPELLSALEAIERAAISLTLPYKVSDAIQAARAAIAKAKGAQP